MNLGLDGKVVLITGAASGIGRSIALGFGRESSKVVVADVNRIGGEETVAAIKQAGGEADFVQTDVSKADEVKTMVDFAVDRYGRLDFAVNNAAGRSLNGRLLHDYDEAEWEDLISVTLKGVWLSMKYEIIKMLDQGSGSIVNMSSAAGIQGQPGAAMYSAAKHGVLGLTKTAAFDYGEKGIRVNAICPGLIVTPATEPLMANPELRSRFETVHAFGRLGRPEEVAAAAMWLCSEAASFVTGHAMFVDGGCLAANRLSSTFR